MKSRLASFYLQGSDSYLLNLKEQGIYSDLPGKSEEFNEIQKRIVKFSQEELEVASENLLRKNEGKALLTVPNQVKISRDQLYLQLFNRENGIEHDVELLDSNDVNLQSFFSNINFFDQLGRIADSIGKIENSKQMPVLQEEIAKMNERLPSNVYVPFTCESIRNYVIVHIPVTELRIFRTKERAPYMLTVECVRLEELKT